MRFEIAMALGLTQQEAEAIAQCTRKFVRSSTGLWNGNPRLHLQVFFAGAFVVIVTSLRAMAGPVRIITHLL